MKLMFILVICLVLLFVSSTSSDSNTLDEYTTLKKDMLSNKMHKGIVFYFLEQMKYPEAVNYLANKNSSKNDAFTLLVAFLQYRVLYEYSTVGLNKPIPAIDRPRLIKLVYPSDEYSQKIRTKLEKKGLLSQREGWIIQENIRKCAEKISVRMYLTKEVINQ